MSKQLVRAFFTDKNDRIVIMQLPNALLSIWIGSTLLSKLIDSGILHNGFTYLGTVSIFAWAYLEVTSGESPFRRALGGFILLFSVFNHFR